MAKVTKDNGIKFFGEIDLNDTTGEIKSDMPAWYFDIHIMELEESMDRKKRMIDRGVVDPDQVPVLRNQIEGDRARLEAINKSRPDLSGRYKDMAWKAYESLQQQIKDTMPTRKESRDGLVNPHEELDRLKKKHIAINPEVAKACGVNVVRGHITGDEANKCYQILGKALGENTNIEKIRREGNSEATRSIHELTKLILSNQRVE